MDFMYEASLDSSTMLPTRYADYRASAVEVASIDPIESCITTSAVEDGCVASVAVFAMI